MQKFSLIHFSVNISRSLNSINQSKDVLGVFFAIDYDAGRMSVPYSKVFLIVFGCFICSKLDGEVLFFLRWPFGLLFSLNYVNIYFDIIISGFHSWNSMISGPFQLW